MIETPFNFEPELSNEDFQKLGQLSLRWSHIEHVIGNCLRVILRLSPEEAIVVVFPWSLEQRLERLKKLAKDYDLSKQGRAALDELEPFMRGIQYVRNNVAHAIIINDGNGHAFHLRSKQRTLTKEQIFSVEELTNYAAHAAYALRFALGFKETLGAIYTLPERPEIPEFLRELIPIRKKSNLPPRRRPKSSPA